MKTATHARTLKSLEYLRSDFQLLEIYMHVSRLFVMHTSAELKKNGSHKDVADVQAALVKLEHAAARIENRRWVYEHNQHACTMRINQILTGGLL